MDVWLLLAGQKFGPYSRAEVEQWWRSGQLHPGDQIWHAGLASWAAPAFIFEPSPPPATSTRSISPVDKDTELIRRLADYEKISAWLWLCLGILQICTLVVAIAGIWNIVAASTRFAIVHRIRARDPSVPSDYEGLGGIILIGIVNLLLGGIIGVLFAAFDLYVRDQILSHRDLFDAPSATSAQTTAPA